MSLRVTFQTQLPSKGTNQYGEGAGVKTESVF